MTWQPVACWERRGSPGASLEGDNHHLGDGGIGGLYGNGRVSSSPTSPRPALEFCLDESIEVVARTLLSSPTSPPIGFTHSHQRRQTGTVRAVLSVLAAVVFAWAVGRGCDRRVAGQSPAQPCKSTDALGGTWTALFPLPSLPSAVSPFHCPTDLQMTTSRRRGERCPLFCAHCESAAPFSGGEVIPPRPFFGQLEKRSS